MSLWRPWNHVITSCPLLYIEEWLSCCVWCFTARETLWLVNDSPPNDCAQQYRLWFINVSTMKLHRRAWRKARLPLHQIKPSLIVIRIKISCVTSSQAVFLSETSHNQHFNQMWIPYNSICIQGCWHGSLTERYRALVLINVVSLRRARLILGWATVRGRVNHLGM